MTTAVLPISLPDEQEDPKLGAGDDYHSLRYPIAGKEAMDLFGERCRCRSCQQTFPRLQPSRHCLPSHVRQALFDLIVLDLRDALLHSIG
jgi:hypothetical protein